MIDGLKLTLSGQEIRELLDKRIRISKLRVARWKRELARTPKQQTEDRERRSKVTQALRNIRTARRYEHKRHTRYCSPLGACPPR